MAGYSGSPLVKKLGIKSGCRYLTLHAPTGFADTLGPLPADVTVVSHLGEKESVDVLLFFTTSRAFLEKQFVKIKKHLASSGGLWIAWPKKASKVATDGGGVGG